MKYTLFIILLSLIYCSTTLKKIECLAKNSKIIKEVANVIQSLKTKDVEIIISTIAKAFFSLKDEVKYCLVEQEEEPILQANKGVYNPFALEKCKLMCGDKYYDYECIQACYEEFGGGIINNDIFDIIN